MNSVDQRYQEYAEALRVFRERQIRYERKLATAKRAERERDTARRALEDTYYAWAMETKPFND